MVQGDKYSIPITIRSRDEYGTVQTVTNEGIAGVRIKLGNIEHTWPDGDLSYDSETNKWLFPVTQEATLKMGTVRMQVRLIFDNGDIINSIPEEIEVASAIIREVETDEGDNSDN